MNSLLGYIRIQFYVGFYYIALSKENMIKNGCMNAKDFFYTVVSCTGKIGDSAIESNLLYT